MLAILNEFYHITIVFHVRNRCCASFHPLKHSMWSCECESIYLYRALEFSIVTDLSETTRAVDHIIRIGWFSSTRNKIGFDGLEIATEQINIYIYIWSSWGLCEGIGRIILSAWVSLEQLLKKFKFTVFSPVSLLKGRRFLIHTTNVK